MKLFIKAEREGYAPNQVRGTMTVEELIGYLEQFGGDTPIYLSHDNGYTYGGIRWDSFTDSEEPED